MKSDNFDFCLLTDAVTEDDWDDGKELTDFLQAPYEMTNRLEGDNNVFGPGSLQQPLPNCLTC